MDCKEFKEKAVKNPFNETTQSLVDGRTHFRECESCRDWIRGVADSAEKRVGRDAVLMAELLASALREKVLAHEAKAADSVMDDFTSYSKKGEA